jgi:hypothetical protein
MLIVKMMIGKETGTKFHIMIDSIHESEEKWYRKHIRDLKRNSKAETFWKIIENVPEDLAQFLYEKQQEEKEIQEAHIHNLK